MSSVDENAYISSIKKIHFLVLILSLLISIISITIYANDRLRDKLKVIDLVYAIKNYSSEGWLNSLPRMGREFAPGTIGNSSVSFAHINYNLNLARVSAAEAINGSEEKIEQNERFDWLNKGGEIDKTKLIKDYSFFNTPGKLCSIGLFQGSHKSKNHIYDTTVTGRNFYTRGEDIYLINFSKKCLREMSGVKSALLMKGKIVECKPNKNCEPEWFIGLELGDVRKLGISHFWLQSPLNQVVFDREKHFSEYEALDYFFVENAEKYIYFPVQIFDFFVFNMASYKTNKFYKSEDLSKALYDLFEFNKEKSSFMGVAFDELLFLRLSPIIFFILVFELYRRLKTIYPYVREVSQPWILLRVDGKLDFVVSLIFCLTPVICFLIIHFLYIDTQGLFLNVFGYQVSPRAILTLTFDRTPGRGWLEIDHWSFIVMFLVAVSVYYTFQAQRYLIKIFFEENRHPFR